MAAGIDETGLTIESLTEIISGMQQAFRDALGAGVDLGDDTAEGKIIGIVGERAALLQQLAQAIYDAFDPRSASGVSLERIAAITGVDKLGATRSLVNLYLAGTPATSIPAGTLAAVVDAGDQFRTIGAKLLGAIGNITIASGTADIAITSITRSGTVASVTTTAPHGLPAGAVVSVSGANESEYNVTAEIENVGASSFDYNMASDPGGSATGTLVYRDEGLASDHLTFATNVVRSVAHGFTTGGWIFITLANEDGYNAIAQVTVLDANHLEYNPAGAPTVTPATGAYTGDEATEIAAEGGETGPVVGLSATIITIVNAISGWDRVENLEDAALGINRETDAELRTRRINILSSLGGATLEAIRGDLLLVDNVSQALVFENDTDVVDGGGRPPHSIEAVVVGGVDQEIGDALFDVKAAGIATFGTEPVVTHTDSQGIDHDVFFSRPTQRDIWLEIDFTVDPTLFPVDGLVQAELVVLAFGLELNIGDDVIVYPSLVGALDVVPGVLDVAIRIADTVDGGGDPSPTLDNNISISETQVSAWDTGRMTFITL